MSSAPSAMIASRIRTAPQNVPFVLPRSRTWIPSLIARSSQWTPLTSRSSSTTSAPSLRPITTGSTSIA